MVRPENIEEAEGDVHGHEHGKGRGELAPARTGSGGGGRFVGRPFQAAMNLASGDELPLQFRVGNEGAFEALPLDRRQFAFQVVKEFFGRHPMCLLGETDGKLNRRNS